jgi:hypothetical protein
MKDTLQFNKIAINEITDGPGINWISGLKGIKNSSQAHLS